MKRLTQAERTLAKVDREDWQKESVNATLRFVLGTFYFSFLFGVSPVLVIKLGWAKGLMLVGAGFFSAVAFHRRLFKRMKGLRSRAGAEPWALPGHKSEAAEGEP